MPEVKAYLNGTWGPSFGPPGVVTKSTSNSAFTHGVTAAWVDDDAGSWTKLVELKPAAAVLTATNNSGRIDLSWDISSSSNVSKFEVYFSTNGVNFSKWGTEPTAAARTAIFGRVSPPVTYWFFIRSVAFNNLTSDSAVVSVGVGGVTAFTTLTHSRGSSGWHGRSFTFTAGVQSSTSTITNVSATLYWRQNTSQGWSVAATYSENATSMTKTFNFSSFDYGQRMFRVDLTATDNQTLQNNGTTGTGYQFTQVYETTELTAADISGGVPTISGTVLTKTDPGSGTATNNRELRFTVGFDAGVDRSEYDSALLVLYNTNWTEKARISVDIGPLKTNQGVRQESSHTFSSLDAGTEYYCIFYVYDDQGADRSVQNNQTTYAVQSTNYTYQSGTATSSNRGTYDAGHPYWIGLNGEYIGDAPFGAQYNTSKDQIRDGNNNTWYVTVSMSSTATTSVFQRIRVYRFNDFSINNSSYYIHWIEYQTPQSHSISAQLYDYRQGIWFGGGGSDPSVGDPRIDSNSNVNGTWRVTVDRGVGTALEAGTSNYRTLFDIRAVMGNPRIYGGLGGYRVALAEVRVNTTWYNTYPTYATGTYYW